MEKQSIIWYRDHVSDLRQQMNLVYSYKFDSVVVNLSNPLFKREFQVVRYR